jgi:hypothetical protein
MLPTVDDPPAPPEPGLPPQVEADSYAALLFWALIAVGAIAYGIWSAVA